MNGLQFLHLLHYLGLAWGVGGATVGAILMFKGNKDAALARVGVKINAFLSKMTAAGLVILIASGLPLVFVTGHSLSSTILIVKIILVVALVLNGLNIMKRLQPQMSKLLPPAGEEPSAEFKEAKKSANFAVYSSLALWYAILILSVLL